MSCDQKRVGHRSWIATLGAVALVVASCSVTETMAAPSCSGDSGSSLIVAQSVPTATLLPCFDALPTGWEFETIDITQAGTTIVIDSDRAGEAAARFHYRAECDVGPAISTPSDYEQTDRFELIHEVSPRFRGERYYRFEGGCVWWHFDFDVAVASAMSVELGNTLQLLDRKIVNDQLRVTFIDEEL